VNFDYKDYNKIARQLAGQEVVPEPNQEAKLRAAISRAYYCAFLSARRYLSLKEKELTIPEVGAHDYVHNKLLQMNGKLKTAGQELKTMKYQRNDADYDKTIRNINALISIVLAKSDFIANTVNDEIRKLQTI
jgi:uncharacterized protein (UPF0332 family)